MSDHEIFSPVDSCPSKIPERGKQGSAVCQKERKIKSVNKERDPSERKESDSEDRREDR